MTDDRPIVKLIRLSDVEYEILICDTALIQLNVPYELGVQLCIGGELVHKNWGYVSKTDGYAYRPITFECLDSAKEYARRTLGAILGATCDEQEKDFIQLGNIEF